MTEFPFQDLFEVKCLVKNADIHLSTRIESGVKQLLAFIIGNGNLVLHYIFGDIAPLIKIIPWFSNQRKSIQAICFDPSATWLLAVAFDGSVFIIPALSLVDKKQKIDCKWSVNDLTQLPKHPDLPDAKPSTAIWWQTLDCNQNAFIGFENGTICLISLTDGKCLGSCRVGESIKQLNIYHDNASDTVSLLITGDNGQQWKLTIEQRSTSYLWPGDSTGQNEDHTKSRLHSLKQMGADKLANLRQRFTEGRIGRRDSQTSDSTSECSHTESTHSGPELLTNFCDTYFSPQYARNRCLFTAFYRPSNLLTVHAVDVDTAPLYVHKLCGDVHSVLLTDSLIFVLDQDMHSLRILSVQYSESRLEGDNEYNPLASVAKFNIGKGKEKILNVYKLTDVALSKEKSNREDSKKDKGKSYVMPKKIEELNVRKPRIDTCVIVTNRAVYKIVLSTCPLTKFIQLVTDGNNYEKAEHLAIIFSLNMQYLLECAGDILVANGSFHSGLLIYKQAKVHILKRVLKLAVTADCKALLMFIRLCLKASKLDMSIPTKIHVGNLAVMAYTEVILRNRGEERKENVELFMRFLCEEEYYDQVLAVNVACQAGLWGVMVLLAKARGLQLEVVAALCQILQTTRVPSPNDMEFTLALSEPTLIQCYLVCPQYCQVILNYVKANVESFSLEALERLLLQLDPSQPVVLPFVIGGISRANRFSTSLESTLDSVESDVPDRFIVSVKDIVETFIIVLLAYLDKKSMVKFELDHLQFVPSLNPLPEKPNVKRFPVFRTIGCGYEHAAIIRNNCVYTMGVSAAGCLGIGPLLTQSSPPKLVQSLSDMKIKAWSVSCGKRHTLLLTDCGVFSWGSNSLGQLGLGRHVQDSPYPQLISTLSEERIVDVCAGQYHSVALTACGRVFTWGWGVHGQLGHDTTANEYYPRVLDFKQRIMEVAAGHAHTLILGTNKIMYGFGSNAFGQLEKCCIDGNKSMVPVRVLLMPDMYVPVERISTGYFHNIAVRSDQEVYIWGASPQEVRSSQAKQITKQSSSGDVKLAAEPWRTCLRLYANMNRKPIEQVAVGFRQSVILHDGRILWCKNRESELTPPKIRDQEGSLGGVNQRFVYIACGSDFTMAMEQGGRVFAWGSPSVAQTLLGKSADEVAKMAEKSVILKCPRRIPKYQNSVTLGQDYVPVEVPGLPTMAITYNTTDQRTLSKQYSAYTIRKIAQQSNLPNGTLTKNSSPLDLLYESDTFNCNAKTLHYVLETYHGLYDTEVVIGKSIEIGNFQAAAKVALVDEHFCDSLGFQLEALKKYMEGVKLNYSLRKPQNKSSEALNELNEKVQSKVETLEAANMLSASSSLDSLRQWGDDEHQGGCESPCEIAGDLEDIRQGMSQYVRSIKTECSPPISSVSKLIEGPVYERQTKKTKEVSDFKEYDVEIKDAQTKEVIQTASAVIEFYIEKVYASGNHILMQNILMKCVEFWLGSGLPIVVLENVLLKNMEKYFYPLAVLLFCKNFGNGDAEVIIAEKEDAKRQKLSAGFLKQFSTKFCLHLCSMVLENVNKN